MIPTRPVSFHATSPNKTYPTCEIEEYANSRFILVCVSAARLPHVSEATATPEIMYTQVVCEFPNTLVVCEPPNTLIINRKSIAKLAVLEATLTYAEMGVGAPSYTSGAHWWNGTAATLKNMPAATVTNARITSQSIMPCVMVYWKRMARISRISPIFVELLRPYNKEKP